MDDIFYTEQKVFEDAVSYSEELENGGQLDPVKYIELMRQYGELLRLVRIKTRIADRSMGAMHEVWIDMYDKVHFDALTGIYNRRFMEEALKRIVNTIARAGGCLSVMMLDIDYFKYYNDTYGHSAGDDCLKMVAETIASYILRSDDFVARYGGEEFAVVLPNTDENGARTLAEKILNAVRGLYIPHKKSKCGRYVTVSIGVTTGKVEHTHKGLDYIKNADIALYQSKENGRNRYTYRDFTVS